MRKLIINATNIGYNLNGIGIYTLSLLKALAKLKVDINFIVFFNKNSKPHIKNLNFPANFSIKWTNPYISPDYNFIGHLLRFLYSNYLSLKYRDYLFFNTSQLEAMFFRSKQIITIHDTIPLQFKKYHIKQFFYYKYMLGHVLKRAKIVITPSNHTKELLESFYKLPSDKVKAIHNGIQSIYLEGMGTQNTEREKFILYAGRISPTKNVKNILKAFRLIKNSIEHKLFIVGDGEDDFNTDISSDNRIVFKGYVSNDEMLHLYRKASLFIFPSLYEGFGLPPLEAMACECPVVVSNMASLPEVCGDTAYYVDPYSAESIAEGIYKVLTDKSLRQELTRKGLERIKLFSWEKSAEEHLKVFEEISNN